jgi:putative transposase
MINEIEIRRGRHCTFLMHVHLVFVAKYRCKVFDQDAIEKLHSYFASVCADFDVELVEMDGEGDHVHLLVNYPPKIIVLYLADFVLFGDFHFLIIKRVLYLIHGCAEMRRVMFIKM